MEQHSTSLFKFRAGEEKDLEALEDNYLWFSACDNLNDPFEGLSFIDDSEIDDEIYHKFRKNLMKNSTKKNHTSSHNDYLSDQEFTKIWFEEFISQWITNTAIYSCSIDYPFLDRPTNMEHVLGSMGLWGHYANGLRGFCIEFNHEKLIKSLTKNSSTHIGSSIVNYSKKNRPTINLKTYLNDFITDDLTNTRAEYQTAYATKHEGTWEYEQECRFFSQTSGKHYFDPSCIRAVYIGEKMPTKEKIKIENCVRAKHEDIKIAYVSVDKLGKDYQLIVKSSLMMSL